MILNFRPVSDYKIMRGAELATPGVMIIMAIGIIVFMVVYRVIFKRRRK